MPELGDSGGAGAASRGQQGYGDGGGSGAADRGWWLLRRRSSGGDGVPELGNHGGSRELELELMGGGGAVR